jgi:hypothetical protein
MATKKVDKKLGELHIDVVEAKEKDATIPFNVQLSTSGTLTTQNGIIALVSSIGMIVEDVVRTAVDIEFAENLSDEERAELQDIIILPLMDALGSQLGLIESSLNYVLKHINMRDADALRALFAENQEIEVNNGEQSE